MSFINVFLKKSNGAFRRLRRWYLTKPTVSLKNHELFTGLNEKSVCIDCGANIGDVTEKLRSFGSKVYAFEPHPAAFKQLAERFKKDLSKVKLYNNAVLDKEGVLRLFFHQDSEADETSTGAFSTSASLISRKTNLNLDNYVEVKCVRLSDFILELDKKIDILKIDIEGAEAEVIRDLINTNVYKKVNKILVETHEVKVPGLYFELLKLRLLMKFRGINNFNLNWN